MRNRSARTLPRPLIRFQHQALNRLRSRLLEDLSREYWAILLGRTEIAGSTEVVTIHNALFPEPEDYIEHSRAFLKLEKSFIHRALSELQSRPDLNTIVDVHTHPFCRSSVGFSGIDDADEISFARFLHKRFDGVKYASIVLSQLEYAARMWGFEKGTPTSRVAILKTQTRPELIPSSTSGGWMSEKPEQKAALFLKDEIFDRQVLALGLETMRQIINDQRIVVAGVGGLGSSIAEHLIHMGFHDLVLIDPDLVELSNLSRLVGAYYEDAKSGKSKVAVVAEHLQRINPAAKVLALQEDIRSPSVEDKVAEADWLIVATDSHSSRQRAQALSLKYFVPLISAGVNISLENDRINDMSGEVITARVGDHLCLNCLGRINYIKVASEVHAEESVRRELVKRGYVAGADVHEPAVKTLNCIVASLAVDTLINQFTGYQEHVPIWVYENNAAKAIYRDTESLARRNLDCFSCHISDEY